MLRLRAYAPPDQADVVRARLAPVSGVRHLVIGGRTSGGMTELTGDIDTTAADKVLEILREYQLGAEDVTLSRPESVQPLGWRRRKGVAAGGALVWSEVVGRAHEHARPGLVYLVYMFSAGVIAGVGILTGSSILVVGAMAISPDLFPLSATAIGLVERRRRLWTMALVTLVVGLAVVVFAASLGTALLRVTGRIGGDLDLANSVLGESLTEVGPGTVLVALAAGMAGMLAYETSSSAAVGVGISITTIPAAAYVGATFALAGYQDAGGGLLVLLTNVVAIVTAATTTVWVQHRWGRRAIPTS